ncbi:MAG: sulfite exporter TauE/SafE family protein [Chthoniobacterales bacterium]
MSNPEMMTTIGALAAGFAASWHCVGMCGPLACGVLCMKGGAEARHETAAIYHAMRAVSYTLLGALAGLMGQSLPVHWQHNIILLPWLLAIVLIFIAFGIKIPLPAFMRTFGMGVKNRIFKLSARNGAFGLGLATPLLPCGPLYMMLGIALLSGSFIKGATLMLAFSVGTMPLLWLLQIQSARWQKRISTQTMSFLKRGVALLAAAMLIIRIWPATFSENNTGKPAPCPLCEEEG